MLETDPSLIGSDRVRNQDLKGLRVGLTRDREGCEAMVPLLRSRGAKAISMPCIETYLPEDLGRLDRVLAGGGEGYDGLLFTSARAVNSCAERAKQLGLKPYWWGELPVGVAGTGTAAALARWGGQANYVPKRFSGEGLLEAIELTCRDELEGTRWLLPRAKVASEVLPQGLRRRGAEVEVVDAYRTDLPGDVSQVLSALDEGIDLITFASGSAIRNLQRIVSRPLAEQLAQVGVASLGPKTTEVCREFGLTVDIEPEIARLEPWVDAIAAWGKGRSRA